MNFQKKIAIGSCYLSVQLLFIASYNGFYKHRSSTNHIRVIINKKNKIG